MDLFWLIYFLSTTSRLDSDTVDMFCTNYTAVLINSLIRLYCILEYFKIIWSLTILTDFKNKNLNQFILKEIYRGEHAWKNTLYTKYIPCISIFHYCTK